MSPKDCRTISLETGVQNFKLTIALVNLTFAGTQRDEILLYPLLYGFMYIINAALLVSFFRWFMAPRDPELSNEIDGKSVDELSSEGTTEPISVDQEVHGTTHATPANTSVV